jgi:molybdate transport system permease protein
MDWSAFALTLKLAAVVCSLLVILGLPIAHWLAFSRWPGKFLIEAVVGLPLVLPPTVLGFYVLLGFGPNSLLGRSWTSLFGSPLPFTFQGLVFASVLYSLPFMVQPVAAAFAAVDPKLIGASATLGSSRWNTFRRVLLPMSLGGVVTGIVLSFAHTLGEFGVVLMVGGNIPGRTRTVSISIYDQVQALNYAGAGKTSLALLLLSFTILAFVYGWNRRSSLWAHAR